MRPLTRHTAKVKIKRMTIKQKILLLCHHTCNLDMCWTPHFRTKDLKPVTKKNRKKNVSKKLQKASCCCLSREPTEKWTLFLFCGKSKECFFGASFSFLFKGRRRFTRCVTENGRGPKESRSVTHPWNSTNNTTTTAVVDLSSPFSFSQKLFRDSRGWQKRPTNRLQLPAFDRFELF